MQNTLPEYTTEQLIEAINEELAFQGYTTDELAKSTYIEANRLRSLLRGKTPFREGEMEEIRKKLHIN